MGENWEGDIVGPEWYCFLLSDLDPWSDVCSGNAIGMIITELNKHRGMRSGQYIKIGNYMVMCLILITVITYE